MKTYPYKMEVIYMDNNVLNHLIEKINKSEKLKVEHGITGQKLNMMKIIE